MYNICTHSISYYDIDKHDFIIFEAHMGKFIVSEEKYTLPTT